MLKAAIFTGMATALATLHASADTNNETGFDAWNMELPDLPLQEYRHVDMPLTGAARFEAKRAEDAGIAEEVDFMEPPNFRYSYEPADMEDDLRLEQDFSPGPDLVVPTPSTVFEYRLR